MKDESREEVRGAPQRPQKLKLAGLAKPQREQGWLSGEPQRPQYVRLAGLAKLQFGQIIPSPPAPSPKDGREGKIVKLVRMERLYRLTWGWAMVGIQLSRGRY
jgi:hypothetical protein